MRLVIEADGGSRGNPGPAGYGALVRDADTLQVLARRNGFLGRATNNVAEYRGLIAGLRAAADLDAGAAVEVRMDSKLVVEQMSGRWQVKNAAMRSLAREAHALASGFSEIVFRWVPRMDNSEADRLANEAMDARASTADALDDTPPEPVAAATPAGTAAWGGPVARTALVLLRHGQTPLSRESRFSGIGDPPLTDAGRAQAAAAAERLAAAGALDRVVSSPLRRARETAEEVAVRVGADVVVDNAWRECDFGAFEGLTGEEVRRSYPREVAAWLADPTVAPPGGESFAALAARVTAACDALVAEGAGRVLVVSHVTPIKVAVGRALGAPLAHLRSLHLGLASISEVRLAPTGGVLERWNDAAHLERL